MAKEVRRQRARACEAVRNENWENFGEEMADIFIRLVNCCEVMDIDLQDEVHKTHQKNLKREFLHGRKRK